MKNMISIIREATDRDLVLVDEVCVGTDPTEGAALAMAMIEHFYKAHVLTIMTTHYSELKTFAYEHEGMQNASVEMCIRDRFKDKWEFPGGKVEAGETPEKALVREIKEELAADISVGKRLTTVEYDYPEFHLVMDCYLCSVDPHALKLLEHENAEWLSLIHILPRNRVIRKR